MKSPKEIYREYRLMPSLSLHQLRVAAVAKLICDSFKERIDTNNVVLACLYHDMGNIIKFDLNYFPEFTKPEGLEYWQKIKEDYIKKGMVLISVPTRGHSGCCQKAFMRTYWIQII